MDRLLSMRVFQRVADEGGFAAAARALEMSPAVVTRLVSDLEQHLGTRLMQRTTRKLALTEAGEAYLASVRTILQDIEEAEAAASAHTHELRGTLRVLATPVLASYFLAPRFVQWRANYPKVALDVDIDPYPQHRVEEFDVTFLVMEEGQDASVIARPLVTTEWIVCASPAYLQRHGTPKEPRDLAGHDYLRFPWQQPTGQRMRRMRLTRLDGKGTSEELDMPVVLQSTSFEVLHRAVLDGTGIAVLSKLLVAPQLASGALVHLLPQWILGRYTIYAAMPSRKQLPARTRAFLDALGKIVAEAATARS